MPVLAALARRMSKLVLSTFMVILTDLPLAISRRICPVPLRSISSSLNLGSLMVKPSELTPGCRSKNPDDIAASRKPRCQYLPGFGFSYPEESSLNRRMLYVPQLKPLWIGKCLDSLGKRNAVFLKIVYFFGQIPFKFHGKYIPYLYVWCHTNVIVIGMVGMIRQGREINLHRPPKNSPISARWRRNSGVFWGRP